MCTKFTENGFYSDGEHKLFMSKNSLIAGINPAGGGLSSLAYTDQNEKVIINSEQDPSFTNLVVNR
jgi:hypothetical protein